MVAGNLQVQQKPCGGKRVGLIPIDAAPDSPSLSLQESGVCFHEIRSSVGVHPLHLMLELQKYEFESNCDGCSMMCHLPAHPEGMYRSTPRQ